MFIAETLQQLKPALLIKHQGVYRVEWRVNDMEMLTMIPMPTPVFMETDTTHLVW